VEEPLLILLWLRSSHAPRLYPCALLPSVPGQQQLHPSGDSRLAAAAKLGSIRRFDDLPEHFGLTMRPAGRCDHAFPVSRAPQQLLTVAHLCNLAC